jgi:hypothetical protein
MTVAGPKLDIRQPPFRIAYTLPDDSGHRLSPAKPGPAVNLGGMISVPVGGWSNLFGDEALAPMAEGYRVCRGWRK